MPPVAAWSQAYAPLYPVPKEEQWYFVLGEPQNNAVLATTRKSLLQAEAIGAKYAQNWVRRVGSLGRRSSGGRRGGGRARLAGWLVGGCARRGASTCCLASHRNAVQQLGREGLR